MGQVNWIDVSKLSFNVLSLLERVQLSWLPGWAPEPELAVALRCNPAIEWYLRHKCPELNKWLDNVMAAENAKDVEPKNSVRQAEIAVMQSLNDLLVYVVDPRIYDAQPFMNWDSEELTSLVDFGGKTVIDVGAGTGRLAFVAAPRAAHVFAVEPVANLRLHLKTAAKGKGLTNIYPVDGLITDIRLPNQFADITMGGHIFGDDQEEECQELFRVTKPGGMVILCPGNNDEDNAVHQFLTSKDFEWSRFEEPVDGMKRKYWMTVAAADVPD